MTQLPTPERAGRRSLRSLIALTAASVAGAVAWVWLLWQQFLSDSTLVTQVGSCKAPTGDVAVQVLLAIAVVLGTALLSAANAIVLLRFSDAWWLRIVPFVLFGVLVLGLLAMAWLTVVSGAMWITTDEASSGNNPGRPPGGAFILGWLLAPIAVSLVALVIPVFAGSRGRSVGRVVMLSGIVPLVLYGVGVLVTGIVQLVRCPL